MASCMKRMLLIRRAARWSPCISRKKTALLFSAGKAHTSVLKGVWMTRMLFLSCISPYRNKPGQIPGYTVIFMVGGKDG